MPMAGFYVLNISPSRSQTHPNLPKGKELDTGRMDEKPILTFIRDWCRTKGRGEWARAMRGC